MSKVDKLMEHVGWQQVSDIHSLDTECGDAPSKGPSLVRQLIENAQNQTGITVNVAEHKELTNKIKSRYC